MANLSRCQIIGPRILENFQFLRHLSRSKSERKRKRLIKSANPDELLSVVEVCLNLLKSEFKLRPLHKKRLQTHVDYIRKLSKIRSERGARRLIQKGSGIALSSIIGPVIIEAARALLSKSINKK